MRFFYFFPLFIAVCAFSLCFRLNTLFAQTTENSYPSSNGIEILTQKIAAQKNQNLFPSAGDDTNIVFDLPASDQEKLTQLEKMQNAAYLADIYGQMRPKAAARILQQLENDQMLLILAQLKPSAAAAIIAEMPPKKAGALTLDLATYQAEINHD